MVEVELLVLVILRFVFTVLDAQLFVVEEVGDQLFVATLVITAMIAVPESQLF